MTIKTQVCNGYTKVDWRHFNPMERSVINSLNLDPYGKPFYVNRNSNGDQEFFPLSAWSPLDDEYHSTSEKTLGERSWLPELLPKTEYSNAVRSDNDWSLTYNSPGAVGPLATPTLNTSCFGVREKTALIAGKAENNSTTELSMDFEQEDCLRLIVPRSINMWSPPPSPIFQSSPSLIDENFSDLTSGFSNSILQARSIVGQENGINLLSKTFDEKKDGSFLFVTVNNVKKLQLLLRERGLEVQDIGKTRTPDVLVVLFKTHEFAKRAFTTQKEIGIRMVPPKFTKRYWLKNPSPKFLVVFETTRRLTVKTGKSSSNVKIGDFLMMDAKKGRGCLVLADQMKGHRMRVVGYIGKFINTDGHIVEQKFMLKQNIVGWISTQSHQTGQKFVLRKSKNKIEDYVYDDGFRLFE